MHDDLTPHRDNHEAAMARADLYKLANYSMKLFKMIQEGQELEGWVQAKVTKAADYIASVYHFMEYEMKTSEYGENLNNSDVYSESVRRVFQQKLTEAKAKAQAIKKKAMKDEKVEEGFPTVADAKKDHEEREKSKGTGKFDKKKVSTGTVYTRKADKDIESDDDEDTPKKSKKVKEGAMSDRDADAKDKQYKGTQAYHAKKKQDKEKSKQAFNDKFGGNASELTKNLKVKEDTRLAMRRGPGADMIRYDKDSPDTGAKKHRDDTAKAAKDLRASGKKLGDEDEAKVGDKTVTRYSREQSVKEVAMSPAPVPQKSGIPQKMTTTVPGMKVSPQDLKKQGVSQSAALGEGKCNHTAKGKKCPVHGLKECGSMYETKNKIK